MQSVKICLHLALIAFLYQQFMTDNDQTINVRTHIATAKQNKKRFPTSNQTIFSIITKYQTKVLIFFSSYMDIAFDNQNRMINTIGFESTVLDLANHVESSPVKTCFFANSCFVYSNIKTLQIFLLEIKKKISMIEQVIFHFKI